MNTKSLNEVKRAQIVSLRQKGRSQVKISQEVNYSRKAVQNAIKRFTTTGSHKESSKS